LVQWLEELLIQFAPSASAVPTPSKVSSEFVNDTSDDPAASSHVNGPNPLANRSMQYVESVVKLVAFLDILGPFAVCLSGTEIDNPAFHCGWNSSSMAAQARGIRVDRNSDS
jgi:hypothetical protein